MEDLNKNLKELTHHDPHFRQNAVRSLSSMYQNIKTLNDSNKKDIVTGLLSRLEIKEDSLEVKVRELSKLAKYLTENEVSQIFSKIITYLTDEKALGKDIYSTCIKAILKEMGASSCETVGLIILPELYKGVDSKNLEIKELCFDTFNDYLNTYNYVLIKDSEIIKNKDYLIKVSLNSIQIDNASLRKTISYFLGNFSVILHKNEMADLIKGLLTNFEHAFDIPEKITYLNALNLITKNCPNKIVEYLSTITIHILNFCNRDFLESNTHDYDLTNDYVETGLNLLESNILKLTYPMKPFYEKVVETVLSLMEYDPNYSYDNVEMDTGDNYDYGDDYYTYEADVFADDSSWKVRRAAVRVIHSFVKSRSELPKSITEIIIKKLVFNLREHDENTKLDVINCLSVFLRNLTIEEKEDYSDSLVRQSSMTVSLIPSIIEPLSEHIKKDITNKSTHVKTAILQLLSTLGIIASNDLIYVLGEFLTPLESLLKENNEFALSILLFGSRLLKTLKDNPEVQQYFNVFSSWVEYGIKNDYYKVNIEAAHLLYHLIRHICENSGEDEIKQYASYFYDLFLPKFQANDIDQEMKISLISTVGNYIIYMGPTIKSSDLIKLFYIYLDKTKNDYLKTYVFQWLNKILKDSPMLDLSNCFKLFIEPLNTLLIKSPVHIQHSIVELLNGIAKGCPQAISGDEDALFKSLIELVSEESLSVHILELMNILVESFKVNKDIINAGVKEVLTLLETRNVHSSVKKMFKFIEKSTSKLSDNDIKIYLKNLLDFTKLNANKAVAIAILSHAINQEDKIAERCEEKLLSKENESYTKNILLILGEIYLRSQKSNQAIISLLVKMLATCTDDIKSSLAITLGKIGINNEEVLLDLLKDQGDNLYYHLIALKEFLQIAHDNPKLNKIAHGQDFFNLLIQSSSNENLKIRTITSECLGLLCLNCSLYTLYLDYLQNDNNFIRSTFLLGLKTMFASKIDSKYIDALIKSLLTGLTDSHLETKVNSFQSLINAAYCFSGYLSHYFADLWNIFKKEYVIKPELIETVDIGGGLKIKNDKALPIRKSIYSTIKILLENIPLKFNFSDCLHMLLYGIDDQEDIQTLCHGCLVKIANIAPESFISSIDSLIENFMKKLDNLQNPSKAGGAADTIVDYKKIYDLVVHIKRLFDELKRVPEVEENPNFINLYSIANKIYLEMK